MSDNISYLTSAKESDPLSRIDHLVDVFGENPGLVRDLVAVLGKPTRYLMLVSEVEEALRVSRSTVYKLIRTGELDRVDIDRTTRVSADSVDRYVQRVLDQSRNKVA